MTCSVLDTKYLATCEGDTVHFGSSLHSLWDSFSCQKHPQIGTPPLPYPYSYCFTNLTPIELATGHTRYSVSNSAHEAGYDSFNTARILLKMTGRYHNYLQRYKKAGDPDPESKAAQGLMEYIHKRDHDALDATPGHVEPEPLILPGFEKTFWKRFVNRLRVNGTAEGEMVLA